MWYVSKIFIFVFLISYLAIDSYAHQPPLYGKNLGHRGGKKHFSDLPENSLILLEHSLKGGAYGESIQHDPNFKYLELDVRETLDGHLIVFHDRTLIRMAPNKDENRKAYRELMSNPEFVQRTGYKRYKEFRVSDLTLAEIKQFHLRDFPDQFIPTLEEYLLYARQLGLQKPIAIDVKTIQTHKARYRLAAIATNFMREYLQKANIIFEHNYRMIGPLIFFASPWSLKNFAVEDSAQSYRENHGLEWNDTYIPIFYKGRYQGYLMSFEPQTLLFFSKEKSEKKPPTQSVDLEHIIYQEPLSQCATALH